jgi:hypothetical protein
MQQSLEYFCLSAVFIYVDLILLHIRAEDIITCKVNCKLQHGLVQFNNARWQKENDDILMQIPATAASIIDAGRMQSRMAALADKFNGVLRRLEGMCIA